VYIHAADEAQLSPIVLQTISDILVDYTARASLILSLMSDNVRAIMGTTEDGRLSIRRFNRLAEGLSWVGAAALLTLGACSDDTPAEEPEQAPVLSVNAPEPDRCEPSQERVSRDAEVVDETFLRVAPNAGAKPILKPGLAEDDKDREIYAMVTSLPVREICRGADWSKVRVLVTEELRWKRGWLPTKSLREVKVGDDGRRIYEPSDIEWQPGSERYRKPILKVINTIMRDDARCEAIDQQSLLVEDQGGLPRFTILCVGPGGTHDYQFYAADAENGRSFKVRSTGVATNAGVGSPLGKADAVIACEKAMRATLSQPRTAEFRTFADTTYSTEDNRARVTIGFTADNGLGNPIDATAECVFEGTTLTSAAVIP
jgi:hypothetical protein